MGEIIIQPPTLFVRDLFGLTLDVAVEGGFRTLDIACGAHYILYVVLETAVARQAEY